MSDAHQHAETQNLIRKLLKEVESLKVEVKELRADVDAKTKPSAIGFEWSPQQSPLPRVHSIFNP